MRQIPRRREWNDLDWFEISFKGGKEWEDFFGRKMRAREKNGNRKRWKEQSGRGKGLVVEGANTVREARFAKAAPWYASYHGQLLCLLPFYSLLYEQKDQSDDQTLIRSERNPQRI